MASRFLAESNNRNKKIGCQVFSEVQIGRHHTDIFNGQNVIVRPSHMNLSFINCMYLSPSPVPMKGDPMNSKKLDVHII